jgi:pyruvate carboxylase
VKKLLVANRGEIAIRVFRAAYELGLKTVAIYSKEDRLGIHRFKADESYLVGEGLGPVKAYLDIRAIVDLARRVEADAIHPGYGFLAENADFAQACREAGIAFVGPTVEQLRLFGDKLAAKKLAVEAGVPIIPGTDEPVEPGEALKKAASQIGYPLIFKASFGGGGRGVRVVPAEPSLMPLLQEARREAGNAFGNEAVFLERYVRGAKHIEVQLLADAHGNVAHLWERDCSVQRRHQKVVEIAPAPDLDSKLRGEICQAALALARRAKLINAATAEFLVDPQAGRFYFIEVNPRIQVEHTVTEQVTGVDLVQAQILVAQGKRLNEPPISLPAQEEIRTRGYALQCRLTTEDPENNFVPDYGRLTHYRSPAGFGLRLDGGTAYSGAVISPYYDSLLVKVTAWGQTFDQAIARMNRGLSEYRLRGVKTNIPFLLNLINHPTFKSGKATTEFIDATPELFKLPERRDRASKLLRHIAEIVVNGNAEVKGRADGRKLTEPPLPPEGRDDPPPGTLQKLKELGPAGFARWVGGQRRLFMTDTTFRDAHQSLLATRVRTHDMLRIAPFIARRLSNLFSLEMWGGATFDAALRFLKEDPWDRIRVLRREIPNILFQMLLRAGNAVGYSNYPDDVVRAFVREAARQGIDLFRIFDCFNWLPNIVPAMEAAIEAGAICEPAICYTGDILDPRRTKYSLRYYVDLAKKLEKAGAHILAIKDMAGLCRPYAAHALFKALREEVGVPLHFHTHDTPGVQTAAVLKAAEAGVAIADGAAASMSGLTSQPNLNSLVETLRHTERDTGLDVEALNLYSAYWEETRALYYPFEPKMAAGTAEVYKHEMPGGQVTNLREQAASLGLGERWPEVAQAYADVNALFGDLIKVTPSSKVVGDMALFLVTNGLRAEEAKDESRNLAFPRSVIEFFEGKLGQPVGGFPEDLRKVVLKGRAPLEGRHADSMEPVDWKAVRSELRKKLKTPPSESEVLSYLMYPREFLEYAEHRERFGDSAVLPTRVFFYGIEAGQEVDVEIEHGKKLILKCAAVGEPDSEGMRTVFFELNGIPRETRVLDRSLQAAPRAHPKADPENPGHVGSPMPGKVAQVAATVGLPVSRGERLLTLEAMKMETSVTAPIAGRVKEVLVRTGATVEARDLLVVLEPADLFGER